MSNFTLFTNDSGAAAGPIAYVQDSFQDTSLPASNNTGLTSTAATNPLGDFFADNDSPRFGVKTLYVKDLVLEQDRSKWLNNKPTYRIVWSENAPFATGYVCGSVNLNQDFAYNKFAAAKDIGDFVGVTSTARRCVFLMSQVTNSPGTVTVQVDGSGSATYNVGAANATIVQDKRGSRMATVSCEASNETNNIHDFRLTSALANILNLVGVRLYFENAGANIELPPGSTYVNKTKVTTTTGASLAIPSLGSSLGGISVVYKTPSSGYAISSNAATEIATVGVGANNSNTINVSTGTGASFPAGTVVAGFFGSTPYIGSVASVSTDALTVVPKINPASGISGLLYKLAFGGPTCTIGSSLYSLAYSIGSTQFRDVQNGSFLDPQGNYLFQYDSSVSVVGMTLVTASGATNFPLSGEYRAIVTGQSSFIRVDGYFSAAEIELAAGSGAGAYGGTFYLNGIPVWSSAGTGATGIMKFPVFTDAGPGWNSFQWGFGQTTTAIAISKINLYQRRYPIGVSFGQLAAFDTIQSFVDQNNAVIGATSMAWGNYRRIYSSQIPVVCSGGRVADLQSAQLNFIPMSAGTDGFTLSFYGKNIALGGTYSAGTTVAIDGTGVAAANIWGRTFTGLTEGTHVLAVSMGAGNTTLISHVDISRTYGELNNLQNYTPLKALVTPPNISPGVPVVGRNLQIADHGGTFNGSSVTPELVTGLSFSFTCKGNPVMVMVTGDPAGTAEFGLLPNGADQTAFLYLTRGSSTIYAGGLSTHDANEIEIPVSAMTIDNPGPGTFTYSVKVAVSDAAITARLTRGRLIVYELE